MRPIARYIGLLMIMAVLAAACGLPADGEPQTIAAEDIPEELIQIPDTTLPADEGTDAFIYLYNEPTERLGIDQVLLEENTPESVVGALFDWRAADVTDGETDLANFIPPGTELQGSIDAGEDGLAVINVSQEFGDVEGVGQRRAVAQIVYTLTSFDEFTRVMFQIEGEDTQVPDEDSTPEDVVDRDDYLSLRPGEE